MMRSRLHAAGGQVPASSRDARHTRPWLGGFNLLPYRQRNARMARRRCLLEWIGAALAGCAALLALAGWQAFQKSRLDTQRASVEQSLAQLAAPLSEHAKLLQAQDEQRKGAARASDLSAPLIHVRDLLDALSFEPGDGVVLQQLRQREYETELLATSHAHLASADWLKRLSAIRGVKGAEVSDLRRSAARNAAAATAGGLDAIEFAARLRWGDPPQKAVHPSVPAAQRPMKSEQSRGVK